MPFRQDGSDYNDVFFAAAMGNDGSIVMTGYTDGSWNATNAGGDGTIDFAAAKIDADNGVLWRWQISFDETLNQVPISGV